MKRTFLFTAALLAISTAALNAATLSLEELDLSSMTAGWGNAQKNLSITQKPLSIGGVKFEHGVGTHADSELTLKLDGKAESFTAKAGVDDGANNNHAAVKFIVYGDDRELWHSDVCKWKEAARDCLVQLAGVKTLRLVVEAGGGSIDYDHADWAEAAILYSGKKPSVVMPVVITEEPVILTPAAPREPRINGPQVYGVRPGSPFLYRIPCTGQRPLQFQAEHLPAGLTLDSESGIITGTIASAGTNDVTLIAKNSRGKTKRQFRIVVGQTLALTPPMGWNSWYIHYERVSDALMRQSADQMINSGMAEYGYQYVNIDDCWMKKNGDVPYRDANGTLLPNGKFPDMKGLADYIHAKGLKAGLYTSPGPWTCGGYTGAYQHEAADAQKFAEWGFDFLKYDWCSYGQVFHHGDPRLTNTVPLQTAQGLAGYKFPYELMWGELQKLNRDVVFNLCQYGMADVWKWGGDVGNSWRTTGDLGLERGSRLPGFYNIGFSNARHDEYARPGAWNDPDYILIGWVGDANGMGEGKKTKLTPNEQYSYMSMWSLMASPLIFSGDMAKLDAFTLNVLCNSEVIGVDQDPLGTQAKILRQTTNEFVLVKNLADGSKAIGLFNLGEHAARLKISWSELGVSGRQTVHDLWRQKDVGKFQNEYEVAVPRHGVALFKLQPK